MKTLELKPCLYCKKLFKPRRRKVRFCTKKCSEANKRLSIKKYSINCLTCGKEKIVKPYLVIGTRKAIFCSATCRTKHHMKPYFFKNGHETNQPRGALSHAWRGGKTEQSKIIRSSSEYAKWRSEVFKRDNWTCQECGIRNNKLHPHHIKSFAEYPELRLEVSNGITLCHDCHKKTPNYGRNLNVSRRTK